MDASSLHKEYTELLSAFRRQLPDPGLRVAVSRDADDWARRCALAVWHAEGAPLTPGHAECWNAIYSDGTTPPSVLFWDLVRQSDAATHLPAPPFFEKMRQYDARTGRSVSRRFLQTLALLLLLTLPAALPLLLPVVRHRIHAAHDISLNISHSSVISS